MRMGLFSCFISDCQMSQPRVRKSVVNYAAQKGRNKAKNGLGKRTCSMALLLYLIADLLNEKTRINPMFIFLTRDLILCKCNFIIIKFIFQNYYFNNSGTRIFFLYIGLLYSLTRKIVLTIY